MDCLTLSNICILVHDGNDFTFLSVDYTSCSDYGNVIDAVIINALDVYLASCLGYDAHIITSYPTIGSSINQCCFSVSIVG